MSIPHHSSTLNFTINMKYKQKEAKYIVSNLQFWFMSWVSKVHLANRQFILSTGSVRYIWRIGRQYMYVYYICCDIHYTNWTSERKASNRDTKNYGIFSKTALLRRTVHKIAWPSKKFQEQDENSPFKLILQFQSINFIAWKVILKPEMRALISWKWESSSKLLLLLLLLKCTG